MEGQSMFFVDQTNLRVRAKCTRTMWLRCCGRECVVVSIWLLLSRCRYYIAATEVQSANHLASSLLRPSQSSNNDLSNVYSYKEEGGNIDVHHSWLQVRVKVINSTAHQLLLQQLVPNPGKVDTSFFVRQPVYISLTTMASRMNNVSDSLAGLVQARVVPSKIFLVVSKNPHLLDEGVKKIPDTILCLAAAGHINVIFTFNTGPHRKLLPVLKRYWNKDVFIVTVDDDMCSAQGYILLYQLLKTHVLNNRADAVVALRARRIGFCASTPYRVTRYTTWSIVTDYNRQEMMLLPTGTGGVLYQPKQFHKVVFSKPFWYATGTADDMMFRLSTMAKNVSVLLGCSVLYQYGKVIRSCPEDEIDRSYDTKYGANSTVYYEGLLRSMDRKQLSVQPIIKKIINTKHTSKSTNNRLMQNAPRMLPNATLHTLRKGSNTTTIISNSPNRRLYSLKKALTRQKRSGNETELFTINRNGGNDLAWKLANDVLKTLIKFDLQTIVKQNVYEREEFCYSRNKTASAEKHCAVYDCDKSSKKFVSL